MGGLDNIYLWVVSRHEGHCAVEGELRQVLKAALVQ